MEGEGTIEYTHEIRFFFYTQHTHTLPSTRAASHVADTDRTGSVPPALNQTVGHKKKKRPQYALSTRVELLPSVVPTHAAMVTLENI